MPNLNSYPGTTADISRIISNVCKLFGTATGFLVFFVVFATLPSAGQKLEASDKEWDEILKLYNSGKLSDTTYLHRAEQLTTRSFKDPSLKERLSLFRKIVWSDERYRPYRSKYYAFLGNHAGAVHQEGFAIYYLQKMEQELKTELGEDYVPSLNEPRTFLSTYGSNPRTNLARRIAVLDSVKPFLTSLPELLKKQDVPINTCLNAMTILNHGAQLYANQEDSSNVMMIKDLGQRIWNAMRKKTDFDPGKMLQFRLLLFMTEHAAARVQKNPEQESIALTTAYRLTTSKNSSLNPVWKKAFERALLMKLIDLHIHQNLADSSNYYFNVLKHTVATQGKNEVGDGTKFLLYAGKMSASNRDYKTAYNHVLQAYELNDSIIAVKTASINNNMYAHLISEQHKEALGHAEEQKTKRNIIIYIIALLLIATVFIFLWRSKTKDRKTEKQIEELNKATRIEIAELEAVATMIKRRMGMELHDGLAGKLANVCNAMESEIFDENDENRKSRLIRITGLVNDAYKDTRFKSHEWYRQGLREEAAAFSHSVEKIVSQALSSGKIEKEVEIDDHCLERVSSDKRIHLLRVIQEAMINILKHAKASKIKLFLYDEEGKLNLLIVDNGLGSVKYREKPNGIGLLSLKDRIAELNGSVHITSSDTGTELHCIIPV